MVLYASIDLPTRQDLIDALARREDIYVQGYNGSEIPVYNGAVALQSDPKYDDVWWAEVVVSNNKIEWVKG